MTTAFVAIEGVLGEHSTLHGFAPITEGVRLVHALHSGYQLIFGTTQVDHRSVEHWLHINGLTRPGVYLGLLFRKPEWLDLSDAVLRAEQASSLRAQGHDLGLVVSSDPASVLLVTEMGIPALLFTNPSYRWAEYRPDRKRLPREWQQIDDEIVRQLELRASDPRLSDEEPVERI
jgi:hypothetical protein